MKRLDEVLDTEPTPQAVADMAEMRIRNNQAFAELQSLNDTGRFLNKHPAEFLRQHKNVLDNIKRYKSYLKRVDRRDRRTTDKANLERHKDRERLFEMIMEQNSK